MTFLKTSLLVSNMSIIEALNRALIGTVLVYIKVTFYPSSRNEIDILYDFEIEVRDSHPKGEVLLFLANTGMFHPTWHGFST